MRQDDFNFNSGCIRNDFQTFSLEPDFLRIARLQMAKAFMRRVFNKLVGKTSIIVEVPDTSEAFYRLLGSMEVTHGAVVVTRTWFGLCKKKLRITKVSSIGSPVSLFPTKSSVVDDIFKY